MTPMLILFLAAASAPQFETFSAPGYSAPVCGAWYKPGEAASAMPLGGLGTGFIDFTSAATFGDNTIKNNWLKPRPTAPGSMFTLRVGDKNVTLSPDTVPQSLRFWGHYPAADVDFGDAFPGTSVYLRAFAPVIPHDAETSGLPVALFRFRVSNRSKAEMPVEIALQWQQSVRGSMESLGNVEGALRWDHKSLAPREVWTVLPILRFFGSKKQRDEGPFRSGRIVNGMEFSLAPEGHAYETEQIQDLLLDSFGGFNWESNKRESAVYAGAPNIGQMFWDLQCGTTKAGRGIKGAYGLMGSSLPAATLDGRLQVYLTVIAIDEEAVGLAYSIQNLSDQPVQDLRFSFCLNADIGGPESSERQKAAYVSRLNGILFSGREDQPELLLYGPNATGCIVSTWPDAHRLASENQWEPLNENLRAEAPVGSTSDGLQIQLPRGTVSVGARADDDDWAIEAVDLPGDLTRVTVNKKLASGASSIVSFAVAWNFPEWISSDGEHLRHHYAKYADAGAVMAPALASARDLEQRVIAWQEKIYSANVSGLLKDAVINSLYILPRNSWWIDDGRFFQSESFTGCPITETFVCRFNGSFPLALMWPDLEKATMQAVAAAQAETGEIPFGFGSPAGSRSPYFHVQHPIVSSEFVLLCWRNYQLTRDASFLMYDPVKKALRYAMTLDKDGDGLVNEDPGSEKGFPANQYYDIWPWWGTSAYTSSIWLAALRAGEETAKLQGDQPFADELRGWFDRGRASFEEKLWTGDAGARYYRLYNDPAGKRKSDNLLANGLCGQWFAYAAGLGELLPKDRIDSHISAVLRLNAAATKFGAVNGVTPDGKPDVTFPDHSAVLTIGETWNFCAMAAFAGRTDDAVALFDKSYANILLNQRTPWNIPWSLDPKSGAIKWGINYYSNPCVWTLFQALAPEAYAQMAH